MTTKTSKIIWTQIDEAPALATYSLLPIVQAFTKGTGVEVETRDISLAGRILANFPEQLSRSSGSPDYLAQLGELAQTPEANIIKLPNISRLDPAAQGGHHGAAGAGLRRPRLPREPRRTTPRRPSRPATPRCLGSAVNPVLREGNSDRRSPLVGEELLEEAPAQARRLEARLQGPRRPHDRAATSTATRTPSPSRRPPTFRIEFVAADGTVTVLKKKAAAAGRRDPRHHR